MAGEQDEANEVAGRVRQPQNFRRHAAVGAADGLALGGGRRIRASRPALLRPGRPLRRSPWPEVRRTTRELPTLRFKPATRRDIGEEAGPTVFHGRNWRAASNEARRPTLFEITWPAVRGNRIGAFRLLADQSCGC
jgi:hypothetical protein